jgi:hypothetical protein
MVCLSLTLWGIIKDGLWLPGRAARERGMSMSQTKTKERSI